MIAFILLQHLFYFILDVRISAINAVKNAKIILFQHLFLFYGAISTYSHTYTKTYNAHDIPLTESLS